MPTITGFGPNSRGPKSGQGKLADLDALLLFIGMTFGPMSAAAQNRAALDNDVHAAITLLLQTSPAAKRLASSAKGALVFPNIVKAGFIVGAQYGNGALVRRKQGGGYYIASYLNVAPNRLISPPSFPP